MVKKETIGKIQLWIGILLLVSSVIFGVYVYRDYTQGFNERTNNFLEELQYSQTQSFENNETRLITIIDLSQRYSLTLNYLRLRFMILESLSILILIISILFITQGLVNWKVTK